jgi:hypothetical protein
VGRGPTRMLAKQFEELNQDSIVWHQVLSMIL